MKYILIVLSLVSITACSSTSKIKENTKEETTQVKAIDVSRNKNKKITIVETTKPDGEKTKTTVITEETETNKKTDSKTDTSLDKKVDTEKKTVSMFQDILDHLLQLILILVAILGAGYYLVNRQEKKQ